MKICSSIVFPWFQMLSSFVCPFFPDDIEGTVTDNIISINNLSYNMTLENMC